MLSAYVGCEVGRADANTMKLIIASENGAKWVPYWHYGAGRRLRKKWAQNRWVMVRRVCDGGWEEGQSEGRKWQADRAKKVAEDSLSYL